jgi:hypothetical protein
MHRPGLYAAPATGTHARHVMLAAIARVGLPPAILSAAFKASLPP